MTLFMAPLMIDLLMGFFFHISLEGNKMYTYDNSSQFILYSQISEEKKIAMIVEIVNCTKMCWNDLFYFIEPLRVSLYLVLIVRMQSYSMFRYMS